MVHAYSSRLITSVFVLVTLPPIILGQHQGHQKPQPNSPTRTTPSPSPAGTQPHQHTPVTKMPSASPIPNKEVNTPTPSPSPSPSVEDHDTGLMHPGPPVVMTRDGIGIRVGSSEKNVISMG